MKRRPVPPLPVIDPVREFDKTIQALSQRHQRWQIFSDFCEMAACSFAQAFLHVKTREQQYLNIVKRYEKEEAEQFPKLLAYTTLALEQSPSDFLGTAFQRLELSSHWHGQFFTPHEVSTMMALMTIGDRARALKRLLVEERDYIAVSEPACGAGGMIIAFANAIRSQGIEPQRHVFFEARDIDATAVHMTMIQLSLLHLPAVIILGDTLTLEQRDVFYTPAYHMGLWPLRLRSKPAVKREPVH